MATEEPREIVQMERETRIKELVNEGNDTNKFNVLVRLLVDVQDSVALNTVDIHKLDVRADEIQDDVRSLKEELKNDVRDLKEELHVHQATGGKVQDWVTQHKVATTVGGSTTLAGILYGLVEAIKAIA